MIKKTTIAAAVAASLGVLGAFGEDCTPTNIVVAPLIGSHWTQNAPYNDYSPKGTTVFTSGWEAGCAAIAATLGFVAMFWIIVGAIALFT